MTAPGQKPYRRVVFFGDVMRTGSDNGKCWQNSNILLFHHILAPIFKSAFELDDVRYAIAGEGEGEIDQIALYGMLGDEFTQHNWASYFCGHKRLSAQAEAYLLSHFQDAFVMGFEMSKSLCDFLRTYNIPFINAAVGPMQFLDDFTFAFHSDDKTVMDKLCAYNIEEDLYSAYAGIVRATAERCPWTATVPSGSSALFCAVTYNDRNLCKPEGGFRTFMDYRETVESIIKSHDYVYFRAHPYGGNTEDEAAFFRQFPNVLFIDVNIYWLFCRVPGLKKVVSLCSSASQEAAYFGLEGMLLTAPSLPLHKGRQPAASYQDNYINILSEFWDGAFWQDVLGHLFVKRRNPVKIPFLPNRLRDIRWTYGPASFLSLTPQDHAYHSALPDKK